MNPPFDVEAFARAASTPSVQSQAALDAPTDRPPPPPALPQFGSEAPSERITLTNEVELERARVESSQTHVPPRSITSSALSFANARFPSVPNVEAQLAASPADEANAAARRDHPASSIEAAVLDAIGGSAPPEITERTIEDPMAEMRERFSLGDYTGALEMSELILAEMPGDAEVTECAESCRTVLENMYAARLGPLDRIPIVAVPRNQMRWISMDHRAGFILSLVDGSSSIEIILDLCGMPKLDAYRILQELVQQKIVAFR